jgi:hypothetical protein
MTCIVGLADKQGSVFFGADSSGIEGWSLQLRADEKIFIKQNMIFGFTSSFRMGQLIRYKLEIPEHPSGCDDHEYLVSHFIEAARECFKKGGYTEKTNERETGGVFLLGYKKKIYQVGSDFQVGLRTDSYDAVGSGAEVALGSLYSSAHLENPTARLNMALAASEHFNCGVHGPFKIIELASQ